MADPRRGAHATGVSSARDSSRARRGVVALSIALAATVAAALLPFADVPLGVSEALLIVAVPSALIGLLQRARFDD
jgi:hypothetical protein